MSEPITDLVASANTKSAHTTDPLAVSAEGKLALPAPALKSSEWARAKDTEGVVCQTHVGGQALLEGIMMRGRYNWAVAVREPKGTIYLEEHDLISGRDKNSWMYKPVVRGCTALVESLALGYRALDIAAQHAFSFDEDDAQESDEDDEQKEGSRKEGIIDSSPQAPSGPLPGSSSDPLLEPLPDSSSRALPKTPPDSASEIPKPLMTATMIIGILLGIGIFVVLPAVVTNLLVGDYGEKTLLWNIVDGVLRIVIFVFYIWLIGRMKDIQRMFAYHGAEHKTIHCYEHGLELTPANARLFPSLHVRCGTAFLLTTMLIAILVFTLVPIGALIDMLGVDNGILRLALVIISRIILLPVVAGLSYEVTVKWAGAHPENSFVQFVLWPGLQMQRLTTRQPDDGQLECAIAAMTLVLEREQREQAAQSVQPTSSDSF